MIKFLFAQQPKQQVPASPQRRVEELGAVTGFEHTEQQLIEQSGPTGEQGQNMHGIRAVVHTGVNNDHHSFVEIKARGADFRERFRCDPSIDDLETVSDLAQSQHTAKGTAQGTVAIVDNAQMVSRLLVCGLSGAAFRCTGSCGRLWHGFFCVSAV